MAQWASAEPPTCPQPDNLKNLDAPLAHYAALVLKRYLMCQKAKEKKELVMNLTPFFSAKIVIEQFSKYKHRSIDIHNCF